MTVTVTGSDVNAITADAVVVPIDASLGATRPLLRAVLSACDVSVTESLTRLASVAPLGLAPGTLLRLPAVGHPHVAQLVLLVLFDGRAGAVAEPDEARIEHAAEVLARALQTLALDRVVMTNLAGRVLDAGEVAATIAVAVQRTAPATTLIFCDTDAVVRHDMGAAIESLGIDVVRG